MTDWCILRTAGSSTLRLSQSLSLAGFGIWTPIEFQVRRDRRHGKRIERMVAVMPTYVFAHSEHLPDLAVIANAPVSPHPAFSIFKHHDRFPLVAERDLAELRAIERKAAAKSTPVVFERGRKVRASVEAFQGLTGQVVETSKGQHTLVAFPGFGIPVKFATWQLNDVELDKANSAARAA